MRASKNVSGIKTDYVWDGATLIGEVYGQTAAQKFTVTADTTAIGISLRSTGETAGITVDVYPWNGSLAASIAGTAVASETIEIYMDETDGVVALSGLIPGEYVLYAHSGYGGAGLELLSEGEGAYRDGQEITGEYIYWVYQTYDEEAYALKQSARTSSEGNVSANTNKIEYVPITGGAQGIEIDKKYINGLGLELAVNDAADIQTFVGNHRGDIIALLDGANRPIANYVYDAYGTEREESFTYNGFFAKFGADINKNRYAGQYLDNESGNYYLRARYYDPGMGRFTQEDPALDGDNWYIYCAGNPVMMIDPSGLISYIFYGPDEGMEEHAKVRKEYYEEQYGEECIIYMVSSASEFVELWNGVLKTHNELGLSIDAIEIISHGGAAGDPGDATGYLYWSDNWGNPTQRLYAKDVDYMDSGDRSVEDLIAITVNVKEVNINGCNSANKDVYNIVFGFMQKVNYSKITGWDGGSQWQPGWLDNRPGGGEYTANPPLHAFGDPWYYVKKYQGTWWKYVGKNENGEPVREREGRRTFYK